MARGTARDWTIEEFDARFERFAVERVLESATGLGHCEVGPLHRKGGTPTAIGRESCRQGRGQPVQTGDRMLVTDHQRLGPRD